MATYKLIQDIEAEDHILGPLTFRQFIYGLVTALFGYFCFIVVAKHATFLLAVFLPPALFTGFLAFPFKRDQPTEVWAVAKLRFLFKPRRRIWDQSGVKELVTITVPKKVEREYTNGLSQTEVKSRLQALANTIDSRGWAVKNVNVNLYSSASPLAAEGPTDRLIDVSSMPQAVPDYDVQASDDILDERNNPIAQQFDQMINASTQAHRQKLMNELNGVQAQAATGAQGTDSTDYWFLNQPVQPPKPAGDDMVFSRARVVLPGTDDTTRPAEPTADEKALMAHVKEEQAAQTSLAYRHLRTIQPLGAAPQTKPAPAPKTPDPVILDLARNDDLNVDTIARQANKAKQSEGPDGEVVISLH